MAAELADWNAWEGHNQPLGRDFLPKLCLFTYMHICMDMHGCVKSCLCVGCVTEVPMSHACRLSCLCIHAIGIVPVSHHSFLTHTQCRPTRKTHMGPTEAVSSSHFSSDMRRSGEGAGLATIAAAPSTKGTKGKGPDQRSMTAKSCVPLQDWPGCTVAGSPNLAFSTQQKFL